MSQILSSAQNLMPDHVPLTTAMLTVLDIHPYSLILKSWRARDSMAAFYLEFPIY